MPRRGRLLGLPYDWTPPTRERLRRGAWDPEDPRVFRPATFGWGYTLNLAALLRRPRGGRRAPGRRAPRG